MLTVNEILEQKGPYFNIIDAERTVLEAISLMKVENISYLIVIKNGEYTGVVSERDYTHKVILQNKHSDTTLVKEIMSTDMPIVSLTDKAGYCMKLMNSYRSRYLPAFEGSEFRGIITINDLMRSAITELEEHGAKILKDNENRVHDYYS